MLGRLALVALLVTACETSSTTSTSDEPLTCDIGGTASLANACVKASAPESNQTALPLATENRNLSGVTANVFAWGVRLSSVGGHHEGVVGFDPPQNGTYEIYLSSNPPFRVVDENTNTAIAPSCSSSIASSECASLRHVGTYALSVGHPVRLEFGPTTVSYVRLHIQTVMPTPAVCTAGELTEETAACQATSAADTRLTANALTTIGVTSNVELAPSTVYGVNLPAVSGGHAGWVYIDVTGTVELYLGTPNIPLRIFNYNDFNDTHTPITECSRYIASGECGKLRRGTRLVGGQYRIELGPSANSYVRVELRQVTAPHGAVKLGPAAIYTADNASSYVSAGDLDDDGALDLAVSCPDDASGAPFVDVLKGDGHGAFAFVSRTQTNDPAETAIADFDRDGTVDIAGIDWDGQGPSGAFFLHGTGNLMYTRSQWGNGIDYNTTISSGDFDGDGTPELVAPWTDSQNATTLGGFVIVKPATATYLQNEPGFGHDTADAVAGDFNGDGKQDVITASATTGAAKLYLGNGSGTVTFAADFTLPAGAIRRLFAFDLDHDGKSDLVATAANGTTISYGTAMGMASPATLAITTYAVAAGDFDHDGRLDLVFGHDRFAESNDLTFYLATDAGFQNAGTLTAPRGIGFSIATGDFNGDGFTDLAVPGQESVQVYLSTP